MKFELILHQLEQGHYAYRKSWDKQSFIELHKETKISYINPFVNYPMYINDESIPSYDPDFCKCIVLPYIDKCIDGKLIERGWKPSVEDLFANDWETI